MDVDNNDDNEDIVEQQQTPKSSYDSEETAGNVHGSEEPLNPSSTPTSKYRECQKNHAMGLGFHAVDGCGEFYPAGVEGSLEALRCAACGCHRNFHRKEPEGLASSASTFHQPQFPPYYHTHVSYHAPAIRTAPPLALPSTRVNELQVVVMNPVVSGSGSALGGKRFRTKFKQEQKEKMLELAERVGWKIRKNDEGVVHELLEEIGVSRYVFKAWMHNNKNTLGKKVSDSPVGGTVRLDDSAGDTVRCDSPVCGAVCLDNSAGVTVRDGSPVSDMACGDDEGRSIGLNFSDNML